MHKILYGMVIAVGLLFVIGRAIDFGVNVVEAGKSPEYKRRLSTHNESTFAELAKMLQAGEFRL